MMDKDFYDRIGKARSLFTSRVAVAHYCHDIRMLEDKSEFPGALTPALTGTKQLQLNRYEPRQYRTLSHI